MPWQPENWRDYNRIGGQVRGTQFVAFKTPLKGSNNVGVPEHQSLSPTSLIDLKPDIGIVIDLTTSKCKYYASTDIEVRGVEYERIKFVDLEIPEYELFQRFRYTVNEFLTRSNGKLVGVHSVHGVNRAGYMICRYMIEEMGIPPQRAISDFKEARGHGIEHPNFISALLSYQPRVNN